MKKVNILKWIIVICLVLLAGIAFLSGIYLKQQWDRTTYFENTTINGFDASGREPKELLTELTKAYSAPSVTVNENGEEAMSATLDQLGYEVDQSALLERLNQALAMQKSSIPVLIGSLMNGNHFQVEVTFTFDEAVFNAAVNSAALKNPRTASVDAQMLYDEPTKTYYIQPEVNGNEMEDADLQALVKERVDSLTSAEDPQEDLTIDIPDSIYIKPQVTGDDVELNNICNIYNH